MTEGFLTKLGFALLFAGVAMLITGSLPKDKMEKVNTMIGGKPTGENQPPLRVQLIFGAVIFIFVGLLLSRLITMPNFGGGQVDVPAKKSVSPRSR